MIMRRSLTDRLFKAYLEKGWRGFIFLWRLGGRDFRSTLRATTALGSNFELSPFDYIDSIVLHEGYYEPEVIEAITSVLGSGVLWDIGANFGLHCLTAKRCLPGSRVIAFEPSIAMLARLWRNRALNELDIDIFPLALSDRQGFQMLYHGPAGNPGMSTLSQPPIGACFGTSLVAVVRGDDLVAQGIVPAPTVIKVDVEGYELHVLQGLANTLLLPSLRAVIFEDSPVRQTPVKTLLQSAGFTCDLLHRSESSRHGLENFIASHSTRSN
jgi:FkbM family methyltransferase